MKTLFAALLLSATGAVSLPAQTPGETTRTPQAASDSAAVAAVVTRYHHALSTGDSAQAVALLAEDALVLEGGHLETRAEYLAHHLPADIAFAQAVSREVDGIRVDVRGDIAWTASTSVTRGEYKGQVIHSAGAETMVLARTPDGWKIASIHWSSRPLQPE